MQKAETSLIPDQNPVEKPKITKIIDIPIGDARIDIAVDDKGLVYVNWPIDKKDACLEALTLYMNAVCQSLKLVSTYQKPIIEKAKPSIMDFVRGIKK